MKVEGPAYCYNVCDYHDGVYFEITIGKSSTGLESSEISWFQQCCFNASSVSRKGETGYCELFKTGKLSKKVFEILRNPLSVTSDCSEEYRPRPCSRCSLG